MSGASNSQVMPIARTNPNGIPCRNVWKNPNISWDEVSVRAKLRSTPQGRNVCAALDPHFDRDAPRVLLALEKVWRSYLGGSLGLGDGGLWPLNLDGLIPSYLNAWGHEYRMWQAHQILKPANSPQEDWRVQVAQRQEATSLGRKGEDPVLPEPSIPRPVIPTWVDGQTRLVLVPAPGWNPAWMPAVVHFPVEIFGPEMPFNFPLRLEGQGVAMEVDALRDLAVLPSVVEGSNYPSVTEWLLDICHLQQMAWSASPILPTST